MAVGTDTLESNKNNQLARPPAPVRDTGVVSDWITVITGGGLETQDASTITDPTAEITNSTRKLVTIEMGTLAVFRMKYDDGITSSQDPVIKVFGRVYDEEADTSGNWMILKTIEDTPAITMTIATAESTDVSDGTDNWTDPDLKANVVDLCGCNQVLVGVQTIFTASAGDATLASLEMKVI